MDKLEIIDTLCEISSRLAALVSRMAAEIEQANIADGVQHSLIKEMESCEERTRRIVGNE